MSLKDRSLPNPDEFNRGGSKLEPDVLFGKHEQIYLALCLIVLKLTDWTLNFILTK